VFLKSRWAEDTILGNFNELFKPYVSLSVGPAAAAIFCSNYNMLFYCIKNGSMHEINMC
jgi:hypothetical protein